MMLKTMTPARRRAGFTLIETIVTVGLIAVLAAFVIPSVIQKAGAGDPVKVQNDLNTVRTAIETFATDTKAGFPHQISLLTSKPVAATDHLIDSTLITSGQVSLWNGPYLGATISSTVKDSIATGYTAYIRNFIDRYDIVNNAAAHDTLGVVNVAFSATSTLFAAIRIDGLTVAQAKAMNTLFDGANDANLGDGSNTTGRFRFLAPALTGPQANQVVAYYMAAPITQ